MSVAGKRKYALLLALMALIGAMLPAQASFESSQDYLFTIDGLEGQSVSAMMENRQQRLRVAAMVYIGGVNSIGEVYDSLNSADANTKVFLASSPANPFFFSLYLFAPGSTWVFSCNTLFGQIVAGPMHYTIVPGAADMVMASLKSDGSIADYYQVSFSDILMTIFDPGLASPPRSYTPASLNQRMSTRSGPGTQYTEELGTLPQDTQIMLVESVTTGVPWGLVEFYRNGVKVRAYTGMKRINAYGPVAQGTLDYDEVVLSRSTEVYYGPGYDYGQRKETVPAGTTLRVFGSENGFSLCDYRSGNQWVRAYFPQI